MNLVLQMMAGVSLAGLAEAMALGIFSVFLSDFISVSYCFFAITLADRAGLKQKDVLEVLELTSMASPMMLEKGQGKKVLLNAFERFLMFLLQ